MTAGGSPPAPPSGTHLPASPGGRGPAGRSARRGTTDGRLAHGGSTAPVEPTPHVRLDSGFQIRLFVAVPARSGVLPSAAGPSAPAHGPPGLGTGMRAPLGCGRGRGVSAAEVCGRGAAWERGAPRTLSRAQGFSRQALQVSLVRWTRRAASLPEASLGASEPAGHPPGCRGSEAGAGPRRAPRQSAGAERCSRVSTSPRAPSLRRTRRAERLEEETRGGGWTGGAKDVRGTSPEQPPLPGPDQDALGLWVLRRGVSFPHVSASPGAASQPQLEAAKNGGLVGPRGRETVRQGCHLLRPGLAASVRSRLCADRAPRGVRSPTRNRPAARFPDKPPSPLPEPPALQRPAATLESHLPGSAASVGTVPRSPPCRGPALQRDAGSRGPRRALPCPARAFRRCNRWSPAAV